MSESDGGGELLKHTFRAMTHRNFRLFFIGQCISWIGTWMQQLALGWLAYRLSNSAMLLGVVTFASQAPTLFVTPFAGVLADRFNRQRMVIATQACAMVQALALAYLTLTHQVQIWHLVALGLVLGFVNAIDIPTRQAFLVEMLDDKNDLPNAIALNSSLVNVARLIGPALAGALILWVGEGMCFLLNGVSYIAVIAALLMMRIKPLTTGDRQAHNMFAHLWEGFTYSMSFAPIRAVILLLAAVSLLGSPFTVLMPVFAKDVFGGGPADLGLMMGASGVGALVGAMYLATRKSVIGLGQWIAVSSLIFGVGLMLFSLSTSIAVAMILLCFCGFGMMVQMAACNIILQTLTDEDKRGRVMSLYTMAFIGMSPFGGLLAGYLGTKIGAPHTVLACGTVTVICGLVFWTQLGNIRKAAHPVLVSKGILAQPDS